MSSPYRIAARRALRARHADVVPDEHLFVPLGLLWLVSLARLFGGCMVRDPFGRDAVLALLAMLLLPLLPHRVVRAKLARALRQLLPRTRTGTRP